MITIDIGSLFSGIGSVTMKDSHIKVFFPEIGRVYRRRILRQLAIARPANHRFLNFYIEIVFRLRLMIFFRIFFLYLCFISQLEKLKSYLGEHADGEDARARIASQKFGCQGEFYCSI